MMLTELHDLYDNLKMLEQHLKTLKAPGTITHHAHAALLAVSWAIDEQKKP